MEGGFPYEKKHLCRYFADFKHCKFFSDYFTDIILPTITCSGHAAVFLAFLSPALAVIYLIMIILLIFLKKIRIPVGCIAIAVNIIYLLGSKYYLDMMVYYAT